ncbi:MAG: hypothetical protein A4E53_02255 [Pelotomaculum sp. PtaB.Bin104]|nr:MAG: hypothetical protein A4E53_02255 [Pelotomaculum sp. PtaB.Bin104]
MVLLYFLIFSVVSFCLSTMGWFLLAQRPFRLPGLTKQPRNQQVLDLNIHIGANCIIQKNV